MLDSNPMLQAQIIMIPLAIDLLWAARTALDGFKNAEQLQNPERGCISTLILIVSLVFGLIIFIGFLSGVIIYGPDGTVYR